MNTAFPTIASGFASSLFERPAGPVGRTFDIFAATGRRSNGVGLGGRGGTKNYRLQGELAEAYFLLRGTIEGFGILRPWGEGRRYDLGLDNGRRIWRVQVKSAGLLVDSDHHNYHVRTTTGSGKKVRRYSTSDIDFLAAFVAPLNVWYIIPAKHVARVSGIALFPHIHHSNGQFEKFRERWDLMR